MSKKRLQKISISGYKSIRELQDFEIRPLNVLIGANGAGKSNLISFFRLMNAIFQKRLQLYVAQKGGADKFLHYGRKNTERIVAEIYFDDSETYAQNTYNKERIHKNANYYCHSISRFCEPICSRRYCCCQSQGWAIYF